MGGYEFEQWAQHAVARAQHQDAAEHEAIDSDDDERPDAKGEAKRKRGEGDRDVVRKDPGRGDGGRDNAEEMFRPHLVAVNIVDKPWGEDKIGRASCRERG